MKVSGAGLLGTLRMYGERALPGLRVRAAAIR